VRELAAIGEAPSIDSAPLDPSLRALLARIAPSYRRVWWPSHHEANRAWAGEMSGLLGRSGNVVRDYLARAYAIDWPVEPRTIHVTSYATFAGAFSLVNGGVIVVSSEDETMHGLSGLEAIFHEAMHQWDPQVFATLGARAKALGVAVPQDLPHALIFFTAGEAVRSVSPDYTATVDRLGIWELKLSGASLPASRLKPVLSDVWKPFLDGHAERDDALSALVARAAAVSK
jgi:hypothetical protein